MVRWKVIFFAVVMLAGQQAFAAQPTIQHIPVNEQWVDSTSCGFDVAFEQSGILVDITFTDAEGGTRNFQAAPQMKQTMTNVDTEKSLTINIAGPGSFTAHPDGSFIWSGTGLWGWGGHPDTGAPGQYLTKGRFVLTGDGSGNFTWTRTGTIEDLCALLR